MINESALTFVSAPYIQNLVTIESCQAYVSSTTWWNNVLRWLLFVMIVVTFYTLYKYGAFKKEKEVIKKAFEKKEE